jgi:aryl-alcohol dehydrogenase-like predicted oxidoreductase
MQYQDYGKTGRNVAAVGFGGMRFDTTRPLAENAELVRYANARGINYW